jgi:uncharacterized protein (TIGR02301 family)
MRMRALLLGAMMVALPLQAWAQAQPPKGKKPKPEEVKKARPGAPTPDAAMAPLSELSETLGALTLLGQLCAPTPDTPNIWRVRMEGLLEAEGEAAGASERMKGAFNRGYSDYATSYARCTPAARAATETLRREAARLARLLNQRFGS